MTTPDPDPFDTPGTEPGSGVQPGDTPPSEGSESGVAHNEALPPPKQGPATAVVVTWVIAGLVAVMLVVMGLLRIVNL